MLVPGHAILCLVRGPDGRTHRIVNCYLQSGHTSLTWAALKDAMPDGIIGHSDSIFVGDFNVDLNNINPSADEGTGSATLYDAGVVIAPEGPTCTSGPHPRTLDGIIVPGSSCAQWHVRAQASSLSDHTAIWATRAAGATAPRTLVCNPARFWALPSEAREELRADLATVALAMGVPAINGPTIPQPPASIPLPGQTPADHPIPDLLPNGPADLDSATPEEGQQERAKWMPLLANWGHPCIQGAFDRWWRKWQRRPHQHDPIHAELCRLAARRGIDGQASAPASTDLAAWLQEMGGPRRSPQPRPSAGSQYGCCSLVLLRQRNSLAEALVPPLIGTGPAVLP